LNPGLRIDAEFFNRQSLRAISEIRSRPHERLGDICARIQHPIEVKRDYEDEGLLTIMAKNVRSNRTDLSDPRFMPEALRIVVARNKLNSGDVLVTRTGANFGQVAPWRQQTEAFACADILVLRQPSVASGYLSSFLESGKGKPLVLRGGYGAAQPHIAPPYLAEMLVPRLGNIEDRIDRLVSLSVEKERNALETINRAQDTLLAALGLTDWTPPEPLTYTAHANDAFAAGRWDAQYFRPLFAEVEQRLLGTGRAVGLGAILDINTRGRQPDYSDEGLPVVNSKHVRTNKVLLDDDNRRAVEAGSPVVIERGDVLINGTGVGTIGRAAPYLHVQAGLPDNHVTVLRTSRVDPIYLAVFLNSLLGQLQIERHIKGSSGQIELYPSDIAKIVFWDAPDHVQANVRDAVLSAFEQERRAKDLLEAAKRTVEIALEDGKPAALAFLNAVEGTS
jgi:type I restriction enzyme S subunit